MDSKFLGRKTRHDLDKEGKKPRNSNESSKSTDHTVENGSQQTDETQESEDERCELECRINAFSSREQNGENDAEEEESEDEDELIGRSLMFGNINAEEIGEFFLEMN